MADNDNTVGRRMRQLRESLGLSQGAFGKQIDMARVQVNKYENGHHTPTIEVAKRIAEGLGITLDELAADVELPETEALNPTS